MLTRSVRMLTCVGLMACGGEHHVEANAAPVTLPTSPSSTATTAIQAMPSFEGKYTLDRARTKDAMVQEIAKLAPDDQKMAQLALDIFEKMDASLEVGPQGIAKMRVTFDSKENEQTGAWKVQGATLVLTSNDGKPMTCKKDGPTLTCVEKRKSGDSTIIFQAQ